MTIQLLIIWLILKICLYFSTVYGAYIYINNDLNDSTNMFPLNVFFNNCNMFEGEVIDNLGWINYKVSAGPDGILRLIKKKTYIILLLRLYTISSIYFSQLEFFLNTVKKICIPPFHKTGSKNIVRNYRPLFKLSI